MADEIERGRLIGELSNLPVREFVAVMHGALAAHTEHEVSGLGEALVLARAIWSEDEENPASRADLEFEFVAWPDGSRYEGEPLGPDQGLWEQGQCSGCGVDVTSNAKRAFCPICGTICGLT